MDDKAETTDLPATQGHRRTVDIVLTAITTVLFIGFLTMLTMIPHALSPIAWIAAGFQLIAYSVLATFFYQRRLERRQHVEGRH